MDPTTVIGMLAMHLLCTGALLHLIARHMPVGSGVHDFGSGAMLFGLAYMGRLALGLRDAASWSVPLDAAMLTGSLLLVGGLRRFTGRGNLRPRSLALIFAGFVLVQLALSARFGIHGRYVSLNLVLGCSYAAMGITAAQSLRGERGALAAPLRTLALMLGGLGVLTLARGTTILALGTEMAYAGTFAQLYFSYAALSAALMALVLVWMVFLRLNRQLAELAVRDPLTRLYNRDGLADMLARHFVQRNAEPVHVLQMDVDHFKQINDQHGHAAGDAVLVGVAQALTGLVRGGDLVARTGGEEFVVVGVGGDAETAQHLAERLRAGVAALEVAVGAQAIRCTVSIGVSARVQSRSEWDQAWREADKALYRAKSQGRDRVETYVPGMTLPNAG